MNAPQGPFTLLIAALGGEGGAVLAEWLYQAAVRAGHHAQSTSIPGVAQRTGATTYYVEIARQAGGARPVFSLNPVPGCIDVLLSSELLETARQVGNGMATRERTLLVSATGRALTVAEKMQPSDGRLDPAALQAAVQRHARELHLLDLQALAAQAGTAISAVLLGALAGTGALPFGRAALEDAIRAGGKGVEASLRGFALAFDAVQARQAALQAATAAAPPDLRSLARQRLVEYQDEAYARLFDQRLARIEAVDRATADELVRWLALWMAFDDIVRVAGAKLAASRMARVRREAGAKEGELLAVYDHFKPGVPEFAALLPEGLATRLRAWDRARVARGLEPWALPVRLGTHTVAGTLALRLMASLKGQRRRGSRFAEEQALIERWLAAVEAGARRNPALGRELAGCGRLIKGYGSTNERGKANLLHIVEHLAPLESGAAEAVRAARLAALADEAGTQLDATLAAHGAPRRPPREQPVRWFKRRPAA